MALSNKQRIFVFSLGVIIGTMILLMSREGKRAALQSILEEDIKKGFVSDNRHYPGEDFQATKPIYLTPDLQSIDLPQDSNHQLVRYLLAPARFSPHPQDLIKELVWKDPDSGFERLLRRQYMRPDQVMLRISSNASLSNIKKALNQKGFTLGPQKTLKSYFVLIPEPITLLSVHNALLSIKNIPSIDSVFPVYLNPNP